MIPANTVLESPGLRKPSQLLMDWSQMRGKTVIEVFTVTVPVKQQSTVLTGSSALTVFTVNIDFPILRAEHT